MDEDRTLKDADTDLNIKTSAYYQFFNSNPVATLVFDPSTLKIIEANDMAVVQYQFTREEFTGICWPDLFTPEDRSHYAQKRAAGSLCVPREKVWKQMKKDTTLLKVEITECPLELANKTYIIAMIHDVTDRIRGEEEKTKLQTQLFQTKKMEAAGQLAGTIAHDFNNLLTSLVGYGSLLEMELPEGSPSRIYVEQMLSSSEKAAQLTQSLLAFSKQQSVSLRPYKLNDILGGIEKLLKKILTEDIVLEMNFSGEDLTIAADLAQLDQVIINIFTNARDAMPNGGSLAITTAPVTLNSAVAENGSEILAPGRYAFLSIADTGTGMTAAVKDKIFDPFFTTKEISQGTGLGLSIAYGIIKQHGGMITVESKENQGTTFNIYFPLIQESSGTRGISGNARKKGTEMILIAEDNTNVRRIAKEVLERTGYTVIESTDGDDAFEKFNEHKDNIDLVLIDMIMPGKNGKEVSKEIKKSKPDVKILFMSGYSKDIIMNKGIYDFEDNFLSKPLSPNELLQSVRELLDK